MSDYNKVNIYKRQMQELRLNPYQYSKLVDVPYEIVKNVIYDSDVGGYNMTIKNFFRQKLFEKHQELEKNYENAQLKATQIKLDEIRQAQMNGDVEKVKELTEKYYEEKYDKKYNDVDYLKWYNEEYSRELLKQKLHLKSITEFRMKYLILIDNKKASTWAYNIVTNKSFYKPNEGIAKEKKLEFIKQLYDILVNGNVEKYKEKCYEEKEMNKFDYKEWFNNFDIEKFMQIHNLTNRDLAEKLNKAYSTTCLFISKTMVTTPIAKDFYDYVNSISTTIEEPIKEQIDEPSEVFEVEMKKDNLEDIKEMVKEDVEKEEINEITQNDVLRNLLINRLTEEEKTLIQIFGGKL